MAGSAFLPTFDTVAVFTVLPTFVRVAVFTELPTFVTVAVFTELPTFVTESPSARCRATESLTSARK
jgi:hypothetical protein